MSRIWGGVRCIIARRRVISSAPHSEIHKPFNLSFTKVFLHNSSSVDPCLHVSMHSLTHASRYAAMSCDHQPRTFWLHFDLFTVLAGCASATSSICQRIITLSHLLIPGCDSRCSYSQSQWNRHPTSDCHVPMSPTPQSLHFHCESRSQRPPQATWPGDTQSAGWIGYRTAGWCRAVPESPVRHWSWRAWSQSSRPHPR